MIFYIIHAWAIYNNNNNNLLCTGGGVFVFFFLKKKKMVSMCAVSMSFCPYTHIILSTFLFCGLVARKFQNRVYLLSRTLCTQTTVSVTIEVCYTLQLCVCAKKNDFVKMTGEKKVFGKS